MNSILKYYDLNTIKDIPEITWVIDNVLPNNGVVIIYGSPGSGKTFIVLDMCLHITHKMEWFGNKIVDCGVIVYLIGEGIYGIKKRLDSWHIYHTKDKKDLIYFVPISSFNIWEEDNIKRLSHTLKKFMKDTGQKIVMVVIDTLARAATGLDENSSRDMGKFLRNFEKIKEDFSCTILFVHHKGKDESRGMRGSSSLLGAADTCIDIRKDQTKVLISIEKQKDGENRTFDTELIKCKDSLVLATKKKVETKPKDNVITEKHKEKKVWTIDTDQIIIETIKKGKSLMEISEKTEIPNDKILKRFRRLINKSENMNKKWDKLVKIYSIQDTKIIDYIKKHYPK